jgi:hypothetical protein
MQCPHCGISFHDEPVLHELKYPKVTDFYSNKKSRIEYQRCPNCKNLIIFFITWHDVESWIDELDEMGYYEEIDYKSLIYPKSSSRPSRPDEVPEEYAADYKEAYEVIDISPKASAALSRRCLQLILRDKAGVKHGDLSNEIQEVLDQGTLPPYLSQHLDAVRIIGNFAAHPNKCKTTGEITSVEPGEAQWCLDILEGLFNFYFVQPAIMQNKSDNLNKKLQKFEKPPMKSPKT